MRADEMLKFEELSDENAALRARVAELTGDMKRALDADFEIYRLRARVAKLEAGLRTALEFIELVPYRHPETVAKLTALMEDKRG